MSSFIPLDEAIVMTRNFRLLKDGLLKPEYLGRNVLAQCETFSREQVQVLLDQPGCESLRVYYGIDEDLKVHAILVGADAEGNDILPGGDGEYIVERAIRCPVECPPPSVLNQ
jgi:hypothetical protein